MEYIRKKNKRTSVMSGCAGGSERVEAKIGSQSGPYDGLLDFAAIEMVNT